MSDSRLKTAIWKPSWYELDQTIEVGVKNKFCFFQGIPTMSDQFQDVDLVFYNQLDTQSKYENRFAEVTGIYHEILGPIKKVDTAGLDYIIVLVDGDKEIVVNAEEEPGRTYDEDLFIEDWSIAVTLANVTDPIADLV